MERASPVRMRPGHVASETTNPLMPCAKLGGCGLERRLRERSRCKLIRIRIRLCCTPEAVSQPEPLCSRHSCGGGEAGP